MERGLDSKSVFNVKMIEENNAFKRIGNDFESRMVYNKRLKQRDVEHAGKGVVELDNPRINYFKKCFEVKNLHLPILEKIYRKTLCLNEYTLSAGHC